MKKNILKNIYILLLIFYSSNLNAQFLTTNVESFTINAVVLNDSLSITAGNQLINGYGNLDKPSIVALQQDSQYFCLILKTEKLYKHRSYTKHYLFAGVKDIDSKQFVLDYELFPLDQENDLNSFSIEDPIIINPVTVLLKYVPIEENNSLNNENTNVSQSRETPTILRLTSSGIAKYKLFSPGGRLFFNGTKNIRTNEN